MRERVNYKGFTFVEVMVATAIFLLFALGIYGGAKFLYKIVYISRMRILETAILSEQLEVVRNLEFNDVGLQNGIPAGVIPHTRVVNRNGVDFLITTTIRNYDDSFDGLAAGTTTVDFLPADYKTVEMSIICANCLQKDPVIASSVFAPDGLEDMLDAGSLYVTVFDSVGNPVSDANVHISTSSTNPFTVVDDMTDEDGMLRIVGAPTGTLSYSITVTKDGMTTAGTVTPTIFNPNPLKPPATVIVQEVTSISFAIDLPASVAIKSIDSACNALPNVNGRIYGYTKIGSSPDVWQTDRIFGTDGGGSYLVENLIWDSFYFSATGTSYVLGGSVPPMPLIVPAGSEQEISLMFYPFVPHSLLFTVLDQGTELPLSEVDVNLSKTGYDTTLYTGMGYIRQTDWYGGSGQVDFTDETKYWSGDGNIVVDTFTHDLILKRTAGHYAYSGWLESSTFNLGAEVEFESLMWEPTAQNSNTGVNPVRMQIATSNSSSPATWEFLGPDGTVATYYTVTSTLLNDIHNGNRYLRYKLFFTTSNNHYTPRVSEISFTYTNECAMPGQVFFDDLASSTYNFQVTKTGYNMATGTVSVSGNTIRVLYMSVAE